LGLLTGIVLLSVLLMSDIVGEYNLGLGDRAPVVASDVGVVPGIVSLVGFARALWCQSAMAPVRPSKMMGLSFTS